MKKIKISLAAIVLIAITFFTIRSLIVQPPPPIITPRQNDRITEIKQEIAALQQLPENTFCLKEYNEIIYHINDYYDRSKLGKTENENNQWKSILLKELYAAYAEKFISQAYYTFQNADWDESIISFIKSESHKLQFSPFLERNSTVDIKFNKLKSILSKYDEINNFIFECKHFLGPQSYDLKVEFPINDVRVKIQRASSYIDNNLENDYVNNCTRLHYGLQQIPQYLFRAHISYLDKKTDYWKNSYPQYTNQKVYNNSVWENLNREIESLDNDLYNVGDFSSEFGRINKKWEQESIDAYNYPY